MKTCWCSTTLSLLSILDKAEDYTKINCLEVGTHKREKSNIEKVMNGTFFQIFIDLNNPGNWSKLKSAQTALLYAISLLNA